MESKYNKKTYSNYKNNQGEIRSFRLAKVKKEDNTIIIVLTIILIAILGVLYRTVTEHEIPTINNIEINK